MVDFIRELWQEILNRQRDNSKGSEMVRYAGRGGKTDLFI